MDTDQMSEDEKGSVFFAPAGLSERCLFAEGKNKDYYYCHDLTGIDAVAFCAAVMLYRILIGVHPFKSGDTVFQDMKDGNFLPPHLASPSLERRLCNLIQSALALPIEKKRAETNGTEIIGNLLNLLITNDLSTSIDGIISVSSLYGQLSHKDNEKLIKEKKTYLSKQKKFIKLKRFASRHKYALLGAAAGLIFLVFVIVDSVQSIGEQPTTLGMTSDSVITSYYEAFSSLDHVFMEACIKGADRNDINVAMNLYVIFNTRQAYEMSGQALFTPADLWKKNGGELPADDVFGVTDLSLEYLSGSEKDGLIVYRADYLLWPLYEDHSLSRSDILTLKLDRKKNWRITEILRTEIQNL